MQIVALFLLLVSVVELVVQNQLIWTAESQFLPELKSIFVVWESTVHMAERKSLLIFVLFFSWQVFLSPLCEGTRWIGSCLNATVDGVACPAESSIFARAVDSYHFFSIRVLYHPGNMTFVASPANLFFSLVTPRNSTCDTASCDSDYDGQYR